MRAIVEDVKIIKFMDEGSYGCPCGNRYPWRCYRCPACGRPSWCKR